MVLLHRGNARDAEAWGKQLCAHIHKQTFEVDDRSTHLTCTSHNGGISVGDAHRIRKRKDGLVIAEAGDGAGELDIDTHNGRIRVR